MERDDVQRRLDAALGRLVREDKYLFENNLGERCIAARLAMYLQAEFPEHNVDAEYNRDGAVHCPRLFPAMPSSRVSRSVLSRSLRFLTKTSLRTEPKPITSAGRIAL